MLTNNKLSHPHPQSLQSIWSAEKLTRRDIFKKPGSPGDENARVSWQVFISDIASQLFNTIKFTPTSFCTSLFARMFSLTGFTLEKFYMLV